jgi:hypothetical protein
LYLCILGACANISETFIFQIPQQVFRNTVHFVLLQIEMYLMRNICKTKGSAGLLLKAVASYFLLVAITASISWQQFAAYARYHAPFILKTNTSVYAGAGNLTGNASISQPVPEYASPMGLQIDVELLEEEDTKNNLEAYYDDFAEAYSAGEIVYTSFLKCRYTQLTYAVYNRSVVPYFILYHSSKNDIA